MGSHFDAPKLVFKEARWSRSPVSSRKCSPSIVFNLTHHFRELEFGPRKTGGGGVTALYHLETLSQIFVTEMPKFFGVDTVLWYYPERSCSAGVRDFTRSRCWRQSVAAWPFIRSPSKIVWRQFAAVSHVVMTSEDLLFCCS